jgi:hypothetical protein
MMIEGAQCTIAWFVDDSKILHVSETVVTMVIKLIEAKFGKMMVSRGRKHVFLGMEIEFLQDGKLSIGMKEYVQDAIAEFQENVSRSAITLANQSTKRPLFWKKSALIVFTVWLPNCCTLLTVVAPTSSLLLLFCVPGSLAVLHRTGRSSSGSSNTYIMGQSMTC